MMLEDFGIEKIKGLDKKDIELVKKYAISLAKANQGPENASCPLYEKGCNNMLCPMLSEPGIWYSEEDLCLNPGYKDNLVVINQKKLKKKHQKILACSSALTWNFHAFGRYNRTDLSYQMACPAHISPCTAQ